MLAAVHDIGHGPRSHIIDPLVGQDHEKRGICLVQELESEIKSHGVNFERLVRLMLRQDPLSQTVMNTPLGTDKLDYLERDAKFTCMEGMPNITIFLDHVYWIDNELVADASYLPQVRLLAEFYRTMYAKVYHRTSVVASERYEQRMISVLLGQTGDEPEFSEMELVEMTDYELNYRFAHSRHPLIRQQWATFIARQQPYPAISFGVEPFHNHGWRGKHHEFPYPAPLSVFESKELRKPQVLFALEREIEQTLGFPDQSILAIAPMAPRRFEPPLIKFITNKEVIMTMEEMNPELWQASMLEAKRYAKFYICTYLDQCPQVAKRKVAKKILEIVQQYITP